MMKKSTIGIMVMVLLVLSELVYAIEPDDQDYLWDDPAYLESLPSEDLFTSLYDNPTLLNNPVVMTQFEETTLGDMSSLMDGDYDKWYKVVDYWAKEKGLTLNYGARLESYNSATKEMQTGGEKGSLFKIDNLPAGTTILEDGSLKDPDGTILSGIISKQGDVLVVSNGQIDYDEHIITVTDEENEIHYQKNYFYIKGKAKVNQFQLSASEGARLDLSGKEIKVSTQPEKPVSISKEGQKIATLSEGTVHIVNEHQLRIAEESVSTKLSYSTEGIKNIDISAAQITDICLQAECAIDPSFESEHSVVQHIGKRIAVEAKGELGLVLSSVDAEVEMYVDTLNPKAQGQTSNDGTINRVKIKQLNNLESSGVDVIVENGEIFMKPINKNGFEYKMSGMKMIVPNSDGKFYSILPAESLAISDEERNSLLLYEVKDEDFDLEEWKYGQPSPELPVVPAEEMVASVDDSELVGSSEQKVSFWTDEDRAQGINDKDWERLSKAISKKLNDFAGMTGSESSNLFTNEEMATIRQLLEDPNTAPEERLSKVEQVMAMLEVDDPELYAKRLEKLGRPVMESLNFDSLYGPKDYPPPYLKFKSKHALLYADTGNYMSAFGTSNRLPMEVKDPVQEKIFLDILSMDDNKEIINTHGFTITANNYCGDKPPGDILCQQLKAAMNQPG
ncbi:hypothetical protein HYU21_04195 [Candidatus Woesearchaeota archaeon]|nr:hypothetical protein [Candidatus Woesearchaeota archaeon]